MKNLGICSVTFRNLNDDKIIELCKKTGFNYIEWGGDVHVPEIDFDNAKIIYDKTIQNGLKCISYGSYYRCDGNLERFKQISNICRILGAKIIRVWAGQKDSESFSEQEFSDIVCTIKKCALIAQENGQIIAFEFHHGTYCNTPESTLRLIKAVNEKNVNTYWQPMYWNNGLSEQERIDKNKESIKLLRKYILTVHVYQWLGSDRYPLSNGANEWKEYIKMLPSNVVYYIEFVMGNTEKQFFEDAKTLVNINND